MIFIPLPLVSCLLFAILLVQMLRQEEGAWHDNPFFALLALYAVQSVVIGLHWGYAILAVLPLQIVLAAMAPALAWLSFRSLTVEQFAWRWSSIWPHLLPPGLILAMLLLRSGPIDLALILIFLAYGIALARLAWGGPDRLIAPRLDGVLRSYRSLQITALATLASPLSDIAISLDMMWTGGLHAGAMVAWFHVIALLVLGTAASVAGAATVVEPEFLQAGIEEREQPISILSPQAATSDEDRAVALALDTLMADRQLYKDTDLNLSRIARRLGQPARRVSSAVNRIHAMSVSQYVNNHRIQEACRLLVSTDDAVINVMMEAGFLSKSNFNREFLRVTGLSPMAWRRSGRQLLAAE